VRGRGEKEGDARGNPNGFPLASPKNLPFPLREIGVKDRPLAYLLGDRVINSFNLRKFIVAQQTTPFFSTGDSH